MSMELSRAALVAEIERYLQGSLSGRALAAWAFDQFYAEAEGRLAYEPGHQAIIDDVLDELMWGDSPPFSLEFEAARSLQQRLAEAEPEVEEE